LCGDTMSDWSSKNPYMSEITENYILNGEGSRKETRHIVFDLGDSGLDYKVGDALGVLAENPPHIVEELLEVQGWDRETIVETHNGARDLYTALKKDFEVHLANKKICSVARPQSGFKRYAYLSFNRFEKPKWRRVVSKRFSSTPSRSCSQPSLG